MPYKLNRTERDKIIEEHVDYARAIAIKIKTSLPPNNLDLKEIIAYGMRGLVEAAERFDRSRKVTFKTFSYYRIRGAIFDGLRKHGWLNRSEYARFAAAANDYLENQSERIFFTSSPSSQSTSETLSALSDALDNIATIYITLLGERVDKIPSDTRDSAQVLEDKQRNQAVHDAIKKLPEKEQNLLKLYYFKGLNLKQAGQEMGLSKSWASRLHARAVQLLSKELTFLFPQGP